MLLESILPLIEEALPPVTRPITLVMVVGPLKLALSPLFRPKIPKL